MSAAQEVFSRNLELFEKKLGYCPESLQGKTPAHVQALVLRQSDFENLRQTLSGLDAIMLCVKNIGREIAEIFSLTESAYFTRKHPLYLAAPEAVDFAPLIGLEAFYAMLESGRVFFFAGDIECGIGDFFNTNTAKPLPSGVISLGVDNAFYTATAGAVQQCHNWRNQRIAELRAELFDHYDSFCPGDVFVAGSKLKLFSFTSRFTSYVRYCTFDCAQALEGMGHKMHVWIEPEDTDRLNGLVLLENLCRIKPDAVLCIDHTRSEHPGVYPEKLPFITWVQDQLPAIFDEGTAAQSSLYDFFFTSGFRQRMLDIGFLPERVFSFIECTNTDRFVPGTAGTNGKFKADISFVSHASTTPEQEFETFKAEFTKLGAPDVLLEFADELYRRISAVFLSGKALYGYKEYRVLFDGLCAEYNLEFEGVLAPLGRAVFERFYHVIGNRFFRQMPLLWAAGMGLDLKLWGHGWEHHPELGRFACGVADNNTDLNSVFTHSGINLHLSHHTDIIHPRLLDCMSAQGVCLIRTNGVFSWKNSCLFDHMWFDTRDDFADRTSVLLDARNAWEIKKHAQGLRQLVERDYSYKTGMGYMLNTLCLCFSRNGKGFFEKLCSVPAGDAGQRLDVVLDGLGLFSDRQYFSQQVFFLLHARCGKTAADDFAKDTKPFGGGIDFPARVEFERDLGLLEELLGRGDNEQAFELCSHLVKFSHISFAPFLYLEMFKAACRTGDKATAVRYAGQCARFYIQMRRSGFSWERIAGFGRTNTGGDDPLAFYRTLGLSVSAKLLESLQNALEKNMFQYFAWLGLYGAAEFWWDWQDCSPDMRRQTMVVMANCFDMEELARAIKLFEPENGMLDETVFFSLLRFIKEVAVGPDAPDLSRVWECFPCELAVSVWQSAFLREKIPFGLVDFALFAQSAGGNKTGCRLCSLLQSAPLAHSHPEWDRLCGLCGI